MKLEKRFSLGDAKMSIVTKPISLASGVKITPNPALTFYKITMLNSLPIVNSKGRAFSYKTLANSIDTIPHNFVNFEHRTTDHPANDGSDKFKNNILGHIIDVDLGSADDVAVPSEAVPVTIYGVLYNRVDKVKDILELYNNGLAEYKSSMECLFSYEDSAFHIDSEFVPFNEASDEMKACLTEDRCDDFEGKPMSFALGGENGQVVFVGDAMTLTPADRNANGFKPLSLAVASDGSLTDKDGKKVDTKIEAGATEYECECIECGHKLTSANHCKDLKCSSCGGQMRRADRPGPGQSSTGGASMKTKIVIETDKTAAGTKVEINGTEIKFDTFDFCAYKNSTDEGISIYSSYSVIEDSEGGYQAPKYFSLASAKETGFVQTDTVERWTKTFKDSLPNSSFAVVEPDYISGKTKDTAARHLPYKDAEGRIDLANLRHSLIMLGHVEPATESMSRKELRKVASKNLNDSADSSLKKTSVRDMSKETASMSIGQIASYLSEIKNLKRRI